MTHLERFKNSISRQNLDRVPISYGATKSMTDILLEYAGKDYETLIYGDFDCDRRGATPEYTGPKHNIYPDGTYDDFYGVRMRDVDYGKGSYSEAVISPLANAETVDDIASYNWPSADYYNYKSILNTLEKYLDYPFTLGYQSYGWYAWNLRGMSQFFEDLILSPELAEALLNKLSDLGYDYFEKLINANKSYINKNFVAILIADDIGSQNGPLISLEHFRRFFKPHYRRLIEMVHKHGLIVEYHSCGSIINFIPDLIDMGIDILNPIQTSAKGMNPKKLKEEYGNDIAFSGGIDVQTILPSSNPQKVRDEVFYLLETMGKNGGYILEPSHAIQSDTPPENVMTMYRAVYEYYGIHSDI